MSQIIQHRRGSLGNIKSLNTNGPIHRGEILVATGSLYISSGSSDSDNYHLSASIFFGGSLTPSGNEYKALTQVITGSGLPSMTTGTFGRALDGILYVNTDDNKLYRLVAVADANPATTGNFTGSHQLISGGGGGGSSDYPSIGTPDDGTYTDGVFPFTPTTTIANAIDQINEVLKVIAPTSPPNYEGLSFAASGTITGKLSFGSNHAISSYTNVGANIGQTYGGSDYASIQTAVSATGSTPAVVPADNTGGFKGIYGDPSSTTGTVNDIATRTGKGNPAVTGGTAADSPAPELKTFKQYAIGDGKVGVMALYLNGARFLSASLSGSDAAGVAQIQDTTSNGSSLTLTATQSVFFSDGIAKLEGVEYRLADYTIHKDDMRNGHNYLTLRHELVGSARTAAKFDWVHDNFSGTMAATNNATHPITSSLSAAQGFDTSKVHAVSGIKFYTPGFEASLVQAYTSSFTGIYQNVYPSSGGITMGSNNMTIDSSTKKIEGSKISTLTGASANKFPDLDPVNHPTTTEDSNMTMSFAATVNITDPAGGIFHAPGSGTTNAACSFGFSSAVTPLLRNTLDAPSITNENRYYYNSLASGSTSEAYVETFRGEIYRQSYSANSIGSTSNTWNGTADLSNSTAGAVQAVQFQTKLIDIKSAGNSGVFTTFHGPSSQPIYSAGNYASGDRSYVRYFKAPFASGYKEFAIEFVGSGKIVPDGSSLFTSDSEYFKVQVMRGTTANGAGAGVANAWADPVLGTFSRLNTLNTSNHYVPLASTTSNISYTENVTLSGGTTVPTGVIPWKDNSGGVVSANDIFGIHIILPEGFTGNIDAIAFNYTNITSGNDGNSVTVPILQNVSSGNL